MLSCFLDQRNLNEYSCKHKFISNKRNGTTRFLLKIPITFCSLIFFLLSSHTVLSFSSPYLPGLRMRFSCRTLNLNRNVNDHLPPTNFLRQHHREANNQKTTNPDQDQIGVPSAHPGAFSCFSCSSSPLHRLELETPILNQSTHNILLSIPRQYHLTPLNALWTTSLTHSTT